MIDIAEKAAGVRAVGDYNRKRVELLRQSNRYRFLLLTVWGLVVAVAVAIAITLAWNEGLLLIIGGAVALTPVVINIADWPRRRRQREAHAQLLHAVLTGVHDLSVGYGTASDSLKSIPGDRFVRRDNIRYRLVLAGNHDGFHFSIGEADFRISDGEEFTTALSGIVVCFPQVLPFPGDFAAVDPPQAVRGRMPVLSRGLFEVENRDGPRTHLFLTDVPDAAASRLPGMVSALSAIKQAWPRGLARLAIRQERGYLVLPAATELLKLPDLREQIDHDLHVWPVIENLRTIIALARIASRV